LCLQLQRVNRESRRCACSPKNHLFASLKAMNSVRNWILCIQDVFCRTSNNIAFSPLRSMMVLRLSAEAEQLLDRFK
ncbi:MAG: hypothetical protein ACWA6U_18680, partial [Breznakibacter sp.]